MYKTMVRKSLFVGAVALSSFLSIEKIQAFGGEIAYLEDGNYFILNLKDEIRFYPMSDLPSLKQQLQGLVSVNVLELGENGLIQSKTQRLQREEEARRNAYVRERLNFNKSFNERFGVNLELLDLYHASQNQSPFHGVSFEDTSYVRALVQHRLNPNFTYLERLFQKIPPEERMDAFTWINATFLIGIRKITLAEEQPELKGRLMNTHHSPNISIFEDIE